MVAMMAGAGAAGVNLSATTGQNAAENSALFLLAIPFLIKAIDLAITINDIHNLMVEMETAGSDEDAVDLLTQKVMDWAQEGGALLLIAELIVPGGKLAEKTYDTIKNAIQSSSNTPFDQLAMAVSNSNPRDPSLVNMLSEKVQESRARGELPDGSSVPNSKLVALNELPIQPTRNIPTWNGSGPKEGVLGVNPLSTSTDVLQNFSNSEGVEFIFDPSTSTFLVRGQKSNAKHEKLAEIIDAPRDQVVGGILSKSDNVSFITNESSGHYWENWTAELRDDFVKTMKKYGLEFNHTEGM